MGMMMMEGCVSPVCLLQALCNDPSVGSCEAMLVAWACHVLIRAGLLSEHPFFKAGI